MLQGLAKSTSGSASAMFAAIEHSVTSIAFFGLCWWIQSTMPLVDPV